MVVKGYKSRLRVNHQEVTGPLHDLSAAAYKTPLFNSSINRIRYFRLNDTAWAGYSRIDTYIEEVTGTLDMLFSYRTFDYYRCRKFSHSFESEEINVICELHKSFKD